MCCVRWRSLAYRGASMAEAERVPRSSLAWLLATQAVILVPHSTHAPWWLWLGWLWVVLWRWQIFRGAWSFPTLPVRLLLMSGFAAGLVASYGGRLDMSAMIGLLLAGFILKLLELRRKRDLLVTIYLGYFVAATQFLFHSGPLGALYGLISLACLTATLAAAHQSERRNGWATGAWRAVPLLLQAIPLMLVLFLLVPRTGALWSVPDDERAGVTGLSDSMSPGDVSTLAQSNALAFRVTFESPAPPPTDRYWRGLVFSEFDGRRWQPGYWQEDARALMWREEEAQTWQSSALKLQSEPLRYEVMLEPTRQPWLFALGAPVQWQTEVGLSEDLRLQRREPVMRRVSYEVTSVTDYRFKPNALTELERRRELQLPDHGNPRTRETARRWAEESASAQTLIQRLMGFYRERFRYTLRPGTLGEHSVDEFLWQTQAGFCEHFASRTVFFLRAAGIPARVVVGYLGATQSPVEDYWTVRQRDAHAWAEVWLEGQGWVRLDPTEAVAPERIEQGLDLSLDTADAELLDRGLGRNLPFVAQLQLRWEAMNYQWHRWVLSYDRSAQRHFLQEWLGGLQLWRIAAVILVSGALFVGVLLLFMFWRTRATYRYPADRQLARLDRKLAKAGWERERGETLSAMARRVSPEEPALSVSLAHIAALYDYLSYGEASQSSAGTALARNAQASLRSAIAQLRVPLRSSPVSSAAHQGSA